jgi:hypothetical protein
LSGKILCDPAGFHASTIAPHAATVAVVISDHGPFSPRVLTQRAM